MDARGLRDWGAPQGALWAGTAPRHIQLSHGHAALPPQDIGRRLWPPLGMRVGSARGRGVHLSARRGLSAHGSSSCRFVPS